MSKTGSTALQRALRAGAEALRGEGFAWSEAFGLEGMERAFATRVVAGADCLAELEPYEGDWMRPVLARPGYAAEADGRFDAEIAAAGDAGARTVIVSHETLWYVFSRCPAAIAWTRDHLARRFATVRVVLYLRRQDDHMASELSQRFKGGRPRAWDAHVESSLADPRYRYDERVADLDRAFGASNVEVRPFERAALHDGDIVSDFLRVIGVERPGALRAEREDNVSWDRETLGFLLAVSRHVPFVEDGVLTPAFTQLRRALERSPQPAGRVSLSRRTAERLLAPFEAGNARLARERLGRTDGVLFRAPLPEREEDRLPEADGDAMARIAAFAARFGAEERERFVEGRARVQRRIAALEKQVAALERENASKAATG